MKNIVYLILGIKLLIFNLLCFRIRTKLNQNFSLIYGYFFKNQSEYRKTRTTKNSVFGHFSRSVENNQLKCGDYFHFISDIRG